VTWQLLLVYATAHGTEDVTLQARSAKRGFDRQQCGDKYGHDCQARWNGPDFMFR
jgi:hypothetical protein